LPRARRLFDVAVLPLKLGLMAKPLTSVYKPCVRSSDWVKVKRRRAVPSEHKEARTGRVLG
jgi:bifunctional non-homologous end joining protein LigD